MTASLEVSRLQIPGGVLVRVRGLLDRAFAGFGISQGCTDEVVVDLEGVERVTSSGVRAWMAALPQLASARAVWLARVPPCVMSQLNIVSGFAGNSAIVSLYLPYLCGACSSEHRQLLDLRLSYEVVLARPGSARCPRCGAAAELDEEPATYLAFVARMPRPQPSAVATRLLRDEAGQEATLTMEKEVVGPVTVVRLSGPLRGRLRLARRLDGLDGTVLVDLTQLTGADAEGAAELAAALHDSVRMAWFHGASIEMLDLLHAADGDLVRERFVDVRLVINCEGGCTATVAGITAAARRSTVACPRCGRASSLRSTPTLDQALAKTVDADIASLLARGAAEPAPRSEMLPPGFLEVRRLGIGGMAEVFLVRRSGPGDFQKLVAVKRILPALAKNERFRALFQREARVAALVSHPNVVHTYELREHDDQLLLVMEYVDGWDLGWLVARAQDASVPPAPPAALRIAIDLLMGLGAAHAAVDAHGNRAAVVHRDVSPHNVLLSRDGAAKIADFGVAKSIGEVGMDTRSAVMGKVSYMAPEQINPELGAIGPHTDVYSAGVVLLELLTGKNPFARDGAFESIQAVLHAPLPPLALDDRELDAALSRWLASALARSISERFPDALAALEALRREVDPRWVAAPAAVVSWAKAVSESCLPARPGQDSATTSEEAQDSGAPRTGDRTQVLSEEELAVDDG